MEPSGATIQITVLTQAQCDFCEHAQQVLQRLAGEYPLSVTPLDIALPDGQALAQRAGVLFPPGILIDGVPFSYGRLSERKLRRELDLRRQGQSRAEQGR